MPSAIAIPSRFLPPPACLRWLWRAKILLGNHLNLLGHPNRGYWFWNAITGELLWDNTMERIYGLPVSRKGYRIGTYDNLFSAALWDDRTRSYATYLAEMSRDHRSGFIHDFRVRDKTTGELRIVHGQGEWIYDRDKPVAMLGYNSAHRLTPADLESVGCALTIEEMQHSANAGATTLDANTVAVAMIAFAHSFHHISNAR